MTNAKTPGILTILVFKGYKFVKFHLLQPEGLMIHQKLISLLISVIGKYVLIIISMLLVSLPIFGPGFLIHVSIQYWKY